MRLIMPDSKLELFLAAFSGARRKSHLCGLDLRMGDRNKQVVRKQPSAFQDAFAEAFSH